MYLFVLIVGDDGVTQNDDAAKLADSAVTCTSVYSTSQPGKHHWMYMHACHYSSMHMYVLYINRHVSGESSAVLFQ